MPDIVSPEIRSRMMSGIRGKNTRPEILVRSALHKAGFRFRLHDCRLPGKPDLVFPKHKAVILVHGCFWHGHDCALFNWPASRADFWRDKIRRNRDRDEINYEKLESQGWRVLTIFECALKGRGRIPVDKIISRASSWLRSGKGGIEIRGTGNNNRSGTYTEDERRISFRIL